MPFIGLLVIFIALLYFYLPETKGLTPREVQDEFIRMTGGTPGVSLSPTSIPNSEGECILLISHFSRLIGNVQKY